MFGVRLLQNKFIHLFLNLVFGIGKFNSNLILKKLGFSLNFKIKNLTKNQYYRLIKLIEALDILIAIDLKKFRFSIFKKKLKTKLLKSFRKVNGLPVRGQRTKTNAKTAKKINF
jgi:small subunit ribosomal protein S13